MYHAYVYNENGTVVKTLIEIEDPMANYSEELLWCAGQAMYELCMEERRNEVYDNYVEWGGQCAFGHYNGYNQVLSIYTYNTFEHACCDTCHNNIIIGWNHAADAMASAQSDRYLLAKRMNLCADVIGIIGRMLIDIYYFPIIDNEIWPSDDDSC